MSATERAVGQLSQEGEAGSIPARSIMEILGPFDCDSFGQSLQVIFRDRRDLVGFFTNESRQSKRVD